MHDLQTIKKLNDRAVKRYEQKQAKMHRRVKKDFEKLIQYGLVTQENAEWMATMMVAYVNALNN